MLYTALEIAHRGCRMLKLRRGRGRRRGCVPPPEEGIRADISAQPLALHSSPRACAAFLDVDAARAATLGLPRSSIHPAAAQWRGAARVAVLGCAVLARQRPSKTSGVLLHPPKRSRTACAMRRLLGAPPNSETARTCPPLNMKKDSSTWR